MDKKDGVAVALGVAVLAGLILIGTEKPIDTQKDVALEPKKAALDVDGGVGYVQLVKTPDGGAEYKRVAATYKRRLPKVLGCTFPDGGLPGEYNRHPDLIGAGCESVADSVFSGENPDLPEKDLVRGLK